MNPGWMLNGADTRVEEIMTWKGPRRKLMKGLFVWISWPRRSWGKRLWYNRSFEVLVELNTPNCLKRVVIASEEKDLDSVAYVPFCGGTNHPMFDRTCQDIFFHPLVPSIIQKTKHLHNLQRLEKSKSTIKWNIIIYIYIIRIYIYVL